MKTILRAAFGLALLLGHAPAQESPRIWRSLFDGVGLTGWRALPGGEWRVEQGVLVGSNTRDDARHGVLLSEEVFDDFLLRARFRSTLGNSGLYFRCEPVDGAVAVHGFQAEVDQRQKVGGLYETGGRAWVIEPTPEQVAEWLVPDGWNDLEVEARGADVVVRVNGHESARLEDDTGRSAGHIGLQLHGGQNMKVEFARVEILDLSGKAAQETVNWPRFRGKDADGQAHSSRLPLTWDLDSGAGIAWRMPVPGLAHASPAIWGERVFVASAVRKGAESELSSLFGSEGYGSGDPVEAEGEHAWKLFCFHKHSGELLWERTCKEGPPTILRHPKASHANSSPTCDEQRVVAWFGSEGLFVFDHEGEPLWSKDLGVLDVGPREVQDMQWGFAASPVLHGEDLLLQCDVRGGGYLLCLDAASGEERWRSERADVCTWATPTVTPRTGGGQQVVCNGWHEIAGYDLAGGETLWRLDGGGDVPVPTPVVWQDLVLLTSAHGRLRPLYAVRQDARGDLGQAPPKSEFVPWYLDRRGCYMQCPTVVDGVLFACTDGGILGAYDARSGEEHFRERLGGGQVGFTACAVTGGGRLYYAAEDGGVQVVRAAPEFEVLAENTLGENCLASPAASEGRLYFRTRGHLLCVGDPDLALPRFAEDDERVGTGGFVRHTRRISRELDGATFTLMAFAVGDKLTLGAMTKQPFQGRLRFELDSTSLDLEWDSEAESSSTVRVSGADFEVEARAAEFRGTRWVNLSLPIKNPGAPEGLRLDFLPQGEGAVGLPAAGRYRVRAVDG